jgi:membrane protein DedA with SNARE-associated domain
VAGEPGGVTADGSSPAPAGAARRRRVTAADVACVGPLAVAPLLYLALLPFVPALLSRHAVLLEAVTGSLASMVTAGAFARVDRAPLLLVYAAPLAGLMSLDPFTWWAGRRYGPRILAAYAGQGGRQRRQVERGERLFARRGAWALVFAYYVPAIPNPVIYFAAGASRMSLARFLLFDLIGSLLWSTMVVSLGFAIGQRAIDLANLVSRYALAASVVLVVGTVAYGIWRQRRT